VNVRFDTVVIPQQNQDVLMSNSDIFVSLAYVLYVVAPAIRDELWLRTALFFNSFGFAIWGLWIGSWPVVIANAMFCLMSLRQMHRAWQERRPADLPDNVRAIGEAIFPDMHQRDLEALWALGTETQIECEQLSTIGESLDELFVIMDGHVEVALADGTSLVRHAPTVVGEVTMLNQDIRAMSARVWRCEKSVIDDFRTGRERFAAPFISGLSTEMASRVMRVPAAA